jgi:hypothetical protein
MISKFLLPLFVSSFSVDSPRYLAPRFHDHEIEAELSQYADLVVNEGRIQIFEPRFGANMIPNSLMQKLRPVDLSVLEDNRPDPAVLEMYKVLGPKYRNNDIKKLIEQISEESFRETLTSIVEFGERPRLPAGFVDWAQEKFRSYGYSPFYDYNVVAFKEGEVYPDEHLVIIGHMDSVPGTIGADDNASGAAAVLEIARIFQNVRTKRSIVFILSEDEEVGLLGAHHYIKRMQEAGDLAKIKFAINMDMIAYNSDGIVDLETSEDFESWANKMAELTMIYTHLQPNKVLNPWGSDHVPFIENKIPALLTIEHWKTHTPCWHQSCDTLNTLNFDFGKEITRLNAATLAEFAELL